MFNIGDGIVNVSAKDVGTGKQQPAQITGGSGAEPIQRFLASDLPEVGFPSRNTPQNATLRPALLLPGICVPRPRRTRVPEGVARVHPGGVTTHP